MKKLINSTFHNRSGGPRVRLATAFLVLLLAALGLGGCAFQDGEPWGRLDLAVEARFAPEAARLDQGRLLTANDYAVELSLVELSLCHAELAIGSGGDAVGFDPANPPEGYTLCHGGHCHSVDGRLVDYEDIAAELGAATEGGSSVELPFEQTVPLAAEATRLDPASCPNDCELERGIVQTAAIHLEALHVAGRVFDRRSGDAARIAPEGIPFDFSLELGVSLQTAVDAAIGKGEPIDLGLVLQLGLTDSLFDAVDWTDTDVLLSELYDGSAVGLAIKEAIAADSSLAVTVSR